jgi:hypothetical protein
MSKGAENRGGVWQEGFLSPLHRAQHHRVPLAWTLALSPCQWGLAVADSGRHEKTSVNAA